MSCEWSFVRGKGKEVVIDCIVRRIVNSLQPCDWCWVLVKGMVRLLLIFGLGAGLLLMMGKGVF